MEKAVRWDELKQYHDEVVKPKVKELNAAIKAAGKTTTDTSYVPIVN